VKRLTLATLAGMYVGFAIAQEAAKPGVSMDPDLRKNGEQALATGVKYLLSRQNGNGSWSNTNFPALTALPLWALTRSGQEGVASNVAMAVDFITACASDSGIFAGAIYKPVLGEKGGGLVNYNTALCMTALHAVTDPALAPRLVPVVQKAREFLARSQYLGKEVFRGGMGYDPPTGRAYTDLSNSYLAYEAFRMTQSVEDQRPAGKRVDLDWKAAVEFLQKCQNDSRFNDSSWVSGDASEQGGFAYHPQETRSGTFTNQAGVVQFRSMPGMTYAGMLSYIYAGVDRKDPRVAAAVGWITKNWSLDVSNRDPKLKGTAGEKEGLYYFYNVLAKGLSAYGQDSLTLADGSTINWRNELVKKLVRLEKPEGFWVNDTGRYWESDPVLVTAYTVMSLETALGR
jgi:squalene-hopene/tetraprenyl-beta-curcumene cyclase